MTKHGGKFHQTISLSIALQPTVKELAANRELSGIIEDLLVDIYLDGRADEQAKAEAFRLQAARLTSAAEKIEKQNAISAPKKLLEGRLKELNKWIDSSRTGVQMTKYKLGLIKTLKYTQDHVKASDILVEEFGSMESVVETWEGACRERMEVISELEVM